MDNPDADLPLTWKEVIAANPPGEVHDITDGLPPPDDDYAPRWISQARDIFENSFLEEELRTSPFMEERRPALLGQDMLDERRNHELDRKYRSPSQGDLSSYFRTMHLAPKPDYLRGPKIRKP